MNILMYVHAKLLYILRRASQPYRVMRSLSAFTYKQFASQFEFQFASKTWSLFSFPRSFSRPVLFRVFLPWFLYFKKSITLKANEIAQLEINLDVQTEIVVFIRLCSSRFDWHVCVCVFQLIWVSRGCLILHWSRWLIWTRWSWRSGIELLNFCSGPDTTPKQSVRYALCFLCLICVFNMLMSF